MGRLSRFRGAVASKLEFVAEVTGLAISLSGATLAVVLGKLIIGLVLAGVAVGFILRLKFRRATPAPAQQPAPGWLRPSVALLAAVEVAALVEATNLPVRFTQEGFAYWHWYLLTLVFAGLYLLQLGALSRLFARGRSQSAA